MHWRSPSQEWWARATQTRRNSHPDPSPSVDSYAAAAEVAAAAAMRSISAHIHVLREAFVHLRDPCLPMPQSAPTRSRMPTPRLGYHRRVCRAFLPDMHLRMSEHDTSERRPSTRRRRRHRTCCRRPVTRLRGPLHPPTFQQSLSILGELFECPQLTYTPHFL